MATILIKCSDCPTEFEFTDRDQAFFNDKGYTPPKRCKPCRIKAKEARAQRDALRGGGGSWKPGDRGQRGGRDW